MNLWDPLEILKNGNVPQHKHAIHIRVPAKWYTSKNELVDMTEVEVTRKIFEMNEKFTCHEGGDRFPRLVRAAVYQLEISENQCRHWQITLFLTKRIYNSDIKKLWKMGTSPVKFYIKDVEDPLKSMLYCMKSKTRARGPYFIYDDQNSIDRIESLPVNAVNR